MRARVHLTAAARGELTEETRQLLDDGVPAGVYVVVGMHLGMLEADLYPPDGGLPQRMWATNGPALAQSVLDRIGQLLPAHFA